MKLVILHNDGWHSLRSQHYVAASTVLPKPFYHPEQDLWAHQTLAPQLLVTSTSFLCGLAVLDFIHTESHALRLLVSGLSH